MQQTLIKSTSSVFTPPFGKLQMTSSHCHRWMQQLTARRLIHVMFLFVERYAKSSLGVLCCCCFTPDSVGLRAKSAPSQADPAAEA